VSLYETALSMLTYPGVWHLNAGFNPKRMHNSAHPSVVPFQAFEASDGWLVVAAPKEKFWTRLTEVMSRPDLAENPKFRTLADRQQNSVELLEILDTVFATRTVAEWVTDLTAAAVPSGAVRSVADAFLDPQVVARNVIVEAEHPVYGTIKTIASPVRVGDHFAPPTRAPQRGEHTYEVIGELTGMTEDQLRVAAEAGAFGRITKEN
jgi:crotonobetainyl-CoA:carnitine CoA-transferase CaiB-like acyl-CoA transferase